MQKNFRSSKQESFLSFRKIVIHQSKSPTIQMDHLNYTDLGFVALCFAVHFAVQYKHGHQGNLL